MPGNAMLVMNLSDSDAREGIPNHASRPKTRLDILRGVGQ
jgi:hypothetical protein